MANNVGPYEKVRPQQSLLFRVVAFFSRLQMVYVINRLENARVVIIIFVLTAATAALGIITVAAYLAKLPLLFSPLAPSAFILFYTAMAVTASPRSVLLSHGLGVAIGILSLRLCVLLWPHSGLLDPQVMNWHRIVVIAISTGAMAVLMILMRCIHPPAAATFRSPFFIRLLGGIPYPFWRSDPRLMRTYRPLVKGIKTKGNFWQEVAAKIFRQRSIDP
ncbi:MAG: HPP family protein [Deltaproteobacteria bacterium]|nr:HPP family protein [Deltaproteobacteria bacterium]